MILSLAWMYGRSPVVSLSPGRCGAGLSHRRIGYEPQGVTWLQRQPIRDGRGHGHRKLARAGQRRPRRLAPRLD